MRTPSEEVDWSGYWQPDDLLRRRPWRDWPVQAVWLLGLVGCWPLWALSRFAPKQWRNTALGALYLAAFIGIGFVAPGQPDHSGGGDLPPICRDIRAGDELGYELCMEAITVRREGRGG